MMLKIVFLVATFVVVVNSYTVSSDERKWMESGENLRHPSLDRHMQMDHDRQVKRMTHKIQLKLLKQGLHEEQEGEVSQEGELKISGNQRGYGVYGGKGGQERQEGQGGEGKQGEKRRTREEQEGEYVVSRRQGGQEGQGRRERQGEQGGQEGQGGQGGSGYQGGQGGHGGQGGQVGQGDNGQEGYEGQGRYDVYGGQYAQRNNKNYFSSQGDSSESHEIKQALKQYHNTDPEYARNGRMVPSHMKSRDHKAMKHEMKDSHDDLLNKIYKDM